MAEPFLPPGPNEVEWLGAPVFRGPVAPMKPTWEKTPVMVQVGFTVNRRIQQFSDGKQYPTSLGAVLAAVNWLNGMLLLPGMVLGQGSIVMNRRLMLWTGDVTGENFTKALQMMGITGLRFDLPISG